MLLMKSRLKNILGLSIFLTLVICKIVKQIPIRFVQWKFTVPLTDEISAALHKQFDCLSSESVIMTYVCQF